MGSEMCIRDRTNIGRIPLRPIFDVELLQALDVWQVIPTRGLRLACLLYTSDAADERSSVDLGGRRIIKKKKNIEHSV
mgnify:CR=1 FL=1